MFCAWLWFGVEISNSSASSFGRHIGAASASGAVIESSAEAGGADAEIVTEPGGDVLAASAEVNAPSPPC